MIDTKKKYKFLLKTANVYIHYKLKRHIPFALYLPITYKCNLRCEFCNIWKTNSKEELNLSKIYTIIEDAQRIGVPYISVFGGEPLLRQDVEPIGKKIKSIGAVSALTTNGLLINEKRARSLIDAYDIIKVSFSGLEKTHDQSTGRRGSFTKTLKGLNNLIKFKKRNQIIIHFVARERNLHEIKAFVDKFGHKVDAISLLPENYPGSKFSKPRFHRLWKDLKNKYNIADSNKFINGLTSKSIICDAGKLYYTIYPDGKVNACNAHQKLILGNIHERSFYDIFKSGLSDEIIRKTEACNGCYMKCTTEVSQIFQMPIHKLIWSIPSLMKTYRLK